MATGINPFLQWWKNLCQYPNATPLRMNLGDAEAVELLVAIVAEHGGAQMVFIDASHDYRSVTNDIATAKRLLAAGGVLCGHDYCDYWPEVKRAVSDSFNAIEVTDTIWRALP